MNLSAIRHSLRGPVPSFRTPFNRQGEVDWDAIPRVVEGALAGNPGCLVLTAGDSHYECLSDTEIADITRRVCALAVPRTMVVSADFNLPTGRALEFAKFCRDCGAGVHMPLPPDWQASCRAETLVEHYVSVAEILPVMIVTNRFRTRPEEFAMKTIEQSLSASENIVAIKEDLGGRFAMEIARRFSDRCTVMAGGSKRLHALMRPYGVACHMSLLMNLRPDLAWQYWNDSVHGPIERADTFLRKTEIPLFEALASQSTSVDGSIHAVYEIFGLCERWTRQPYASCSDEEVAALRRTLHSLELIGETETGRTD